MARFIALIDGEPGAYGAAFPDCPGCTAMGATIDETIASAAEALREWMEDRRAAAIRLPDPRSAETLRHDREIGAEMVHAVVASIPLLLDSGRSVRANLSLDAGLLAEIDEAARERRLTRSAFLASAAREKILAGR